MAGQKICDLGITAAVTAAAQAAVTGYGKPQALSLLASFTTTGGGTTVKAWVQTSFDDGATWFDIGQFAFTTSSAVKGKAIDLTAQVANASLTSGTMADDGVQHGILGDRVRVLVTTVGTYSAGTKLEIWMQARG